MALTPEDAQSWLDSLGPRPDPVKVAKAAMAVEKKLLNQQLTPDELEQAQAVLALLSSALYEVEWTEQEQQQIAALAPKQATSTDTPRQHEPKLNWQGDELAPAPKTADEKQRRFAALKATLKRTVK
ncbi:hypothetical protein [Balneatrix alpica]|uniref:hypothetical protein n=1 Tax=Balneatrix alpica TaxID=75684 RepID=UPI002738D0F1|nr:hypothetical protein [Balneatrix alpica]